MKILISSANNREDLGIICLYVWCTRKRWYCML